MIIENGGPNRPEPKPVSLDRETTTVVVLDLSKRCHDQTVPSSQLIPTVGGFLERVRTFGILIIYTISLTSKGTPLGEVASLLKRRETEPVIYPNSFDKFMGGELQNLLKQRNTKNLIAVGAATNVAVLYTATTAARVYHYNVILPLDGVIARTKYEQEYALHQLSVLPVRSSIPIQFTSLSMIQFR